MNNSPTNGADARFAALEPVTSAAPGPQSTVRPLRRAGQVLHMSGQVAFVGSELLATGVLGTDVDVPTGNACARQCALNLLARLQEELGSLDRVAQVVKLTVFVASAAGFRDQPQVANGASDVFVEVLGDRGRHARSAVGVAELPIGTPVEVEAVVEVEPGA
ncbi:RidA family protein [Pseudactinotalea sp. Z1748]|uniref:RidA family protein n=1 Tax=Pseudactinotalea sp. Z1748 TaxID=3413027 RepID=UPI003C7A1342